MLRTEIQPLLINALGKRLVRTTYFGGFHPLLGDEGVGGHLSQVHYWNLGRPYLQNFIRIGQDITPVDDVEDFVD